MNYAFDLTQNIAKTNIYTCCSLSNICIPMLFAVWFLPCWILHCDLWTCGLAGWKGVVFM